MFPPLDDSVLRGNPKFAALHKTLTTRILNQDGSTKNDPAQGERDATTKALKKQRIRAAKSDILRTSLSLLPLTPPAPNSKSTSTRPQASLPPELVELIILLSQHLTIPNLPPSCLATLESTNLYASLPSQIPEISALLSAQLLSQALPLARILAPTTNASFLHRQVPSIPAHIDALRSQLSSEKIKLEQSRIALIPTLNALLTSYRTAIVLAIQILERTIHGQLSRSSKIRSELLAAESKTKAQEAKILQLRCLEALYTKDVVVALRVYAEHLRDGRSRLVQRSKEAQRELARYGVGRREEDGDRAGKEKVMKEVARVYGEMGREIEEVRRDLARLK